MPDLPTGRSRNVTVSAAGTFGYRPRVDAGTINDFNPFGIPDTPFDASTGLIGWYPYTKVTYFGSTQVYAAFSVVATIETRDMDPATPTVFENRYKVVTTLQVFRTGAPTVTQSQTFTGAWTPAQTGTPAQDGIGLMANHDFASGTYAAAEDVVLYEYYSADGGRYERKRVASCQVDAEIVPQVTVLEATIDHVTGAITYTTHAVVTPSVTAQLLYSDPADTRSDSFSYSWEMTYHNLSLYGGLAANVNFSDASLESTHPGFSVTKGLVQLSGSPNSATVSWLGNDTTDLTGWVPGVPFESASGFRAPGARVAGEPSWALECDATCRDYETGAEVATAIEHWAHVYTPAFVTPYYARKLGTFASGASTYRYPGSGECHTVRATCDDGRAYSWGGGPGLSAPGNWPELGAVDMAERLFTVRAADAPGLVVVSGAHWFSFDPDWADAYGTHCASLNWPGWDGVAGTVPDGIGRKLPLQSSPVWTIGTLQVAASKRFNTFASAANWQKQPDAAFYTANPTYSQNVVISAAGGVQFAMTGAPALLTTRDAYLLKPVFYRYHKVRVKASQPGATFRFCLSAWRGAFPGAVAYVPDYAWEFSVAAADTWEEFEIDLARPPLKAVYPGGVLSWAANSSIVHLNNWVSSDYHGSEVWLELVDEATWQFDWHDGLLKSTGTRTPIRLFLPLDGRGDTLSPAMLEQPGALADAAKFMPARLVINGVKGWEWSVSRGQTVAQFWETLLNQLGDAAADTGCTVVQSTLSADPLMAQPLLHGMELTESKAGQPFGKFPAAGGAHTVYGQHHLAGCFGYYGMGDVVAETYGRVLGYHGGWVWRGALIGNVGTVLDVGDGEAVELRDNDTGGLTDSATTDDDGFYELVAKYGVVYPRSNWRYFDAVHPIPNTPPDWQYSGSPPVYTAQGKLLNSHWIKGIGQPVDGSGYVLKSPGGARLDAVILDRFPLWRDWPVAAVGLDGLCALRSWNWLLLLICVRPDGSLIALRYDHDDANPVTTTIDASAGCSSPCFELVENLLEGTYLQGSTPRLARSFDHGRNWTVIDIPGNYEALDSVWHRGRRVALGYRGGIWYCRVGERQDDGTYSWSSEVALSLTSPSPNGWLRVREDDDLEFGWLDTDGGPHIATCHVVSRTGVGTWS
jgi:hypothetical protein